MLLDEERVCRRSMSFQGEGSRGRLHGVRRVDVRFQHNRDAMHRAARPGLLPLGIQRRSNGDSIRVDLDDRIERRTVAVDGIDPVQVIACQLFGCQITLLHERLQGTDIVFPVVWPFDHGAAAEQKNGKPQAENEPARWPGCAERVWHQVSPPRTVKRWFDRLQAHDSATRAKNAKWPVWEMAPDFSMLSGNSH